MQLIGDAVYHVTQEVETVNCQDLYTNGIESRCILLIVNGHDRVPLLGSQSNCDMTIALVNCYTAVGLFETDNLFTRNRMTSGTWQNSVSGNLLPYR